MWLLTTKGRPQETQKLAQACIDTEMTEPCLMIIDGGDPYPDFPVPDCWQVVHNEQNMGVGPLMQWFFHQYPDLDYYGWLADDFIPHTKGWDKRLKDAAGSWKISYCNDLSMEYKAVPQHITSAFAIGGDLVREVGWFSPPGLRQAGIDSAWNLIGRQFNLQSYCGDVVVEHISWPTGKRAKDATDNNPEEELPMWEEFKNGEVYKNALTALRNRKDLLLTIACVNVGDYQGRGAEYVNNLHDMVARNMDRAYRFVCLTDNPEGLDDQIETIQSTESGWWAKLELFKHLDGEVWFFDLDTLITGPLDFMFKGDLALLRDFYRPDGYGSGVMMWNGDHSHIWHDWEQAGKPILSGGDQEWMERYSADILQDIYPGQFVSYKAHCQEWIPNGAKVICFHGNPRPHHYPSEWVGEIWKIGGLCSPKYISTLNNTPAHMLEQLKANITRDLPFFSELPQNDEIAVLVGGGPSLKQTVPQIKYMQDMGAKVFALNNTHDWLIERGIVPDYHVMLDSRKENSAFVQRPVDSVKYLISAYCHPDVFDALEDSDVTLWLSEMDGVMPIVQEIKDKPVCLVGGGATVGLKSMYLTYLMGFRKFHFFGFDSSYRGEENHAYPQPLNDAEMRIQITAAGKTFTCAPWMAKQAMEFQQQARRLINLDCSIEIHGDGLIPWVMSNWNK